MRPCRALASHEAREGFGSVFARVGVAFVLMMLHGEGVPELVDALMGRWRGQYACDDPEAIPALTGTRYRGYPRGFCRVVLGRSGTLCHTVLAQRCLWHAWSGGP